jgi:hypothetical protein
MSLPDSIPLYKSEEEKEQKERSRVIMFRVHKRNDLLIQLKHSKTPEERKRILAKIQEINDEASSEGRQIRIAPANPEEIRERLIEDRKKHPVRSSPIPSAITSKLKTPLKPKPTARSPILEKSRDADYFLESIRAKLDELHSDIVDMQKQIGSVNERLDNIFRLINKIRRS